MGVRVASEIITLAINREFHQLDLDDLNRLVKLTYTYPELEPLRKEFLAEIGERKMVTGTGKSRGTVWVGDIGNNSSKIESDQIELNSISTPLEEWVKRSRRDTGDSRPKIGEYARDGTIWVGSPQLPVTLPSESLPQNVFTPGPNRMNSQMYPSEPVAPCPFCGSAANFLLYHNSRDNVFIAIAECETANCSCKMVHIDRDRDYARERCKAAWENRVDRGAPVPKHILDYFGFFFGLVTSSLELMELSGEQKKVFTLKLEAIRTWLKARVEESAPNPPGLFASVDQIEATVKGAFKNVPEQIQELFFRGK